MGLLKLYKSFLNLRDLPTIYGTIDSSASHSFYNQKLIDVGFVTVWDLFDSHGNFKQLCYPQHAHLSPIDHYFLLTLFNAISKEWHRLLKRNENAALLHDCCVDLDSFSLHLGEEKLDVEKIQSKLLYETFCSKISSNPTSMKKYTQRHLNYTGKEYFLCPLK